MLHIRNKPHQYPRGRRFDPWPPQWVGDPLLLWLWSAAVAQIKSIAWELPCAADGIKKKKRKNKLVNILCAELLRLFKLIKRRACKKVKQVAILLSNRIPHDQSFLSTLHIQSK